MSPDAPVESRSGMGCEVVAAPGLALDWHDGIWTVVDGDRFGVKLESGARRVVIDAGKLVRTIGGSEGRIVWRPFDEESSRRLIRGDNLRWVLSLLGVSEHLSPSDIDAAIDLLVDLADVAANDLVALLDLDAATAVSVVEACRLASCGQHDEVLAASRGTSKPSRPQSTSPGEASSGSVPELAVDDMEIWRAAGFVRHETIAAWASAGFTPADAVLWYDLDVRGPDVALAWMAKDFTATSAGPWLDLGFDDPVVVLALVEDGITPSLAAEMIRRGFSVAELQSIRRVGNRWVDIDDLLASGVTRRRALEWLCAGSIPAFGGHDVVVSWASAEYGPRSASHWRTAGVEVPESVHRWRQHRFDPASASPWIAIGVEAERARSWLTLGFGAAEAAEWIAAGVCEPAGAQGMKSAGIEVSDVSSAPLAAYRADALVSLVSAGAVKTDLPGFMEMFPDASAAVPWVEAGLDLDDTRRWLEAGFKRPMDALTWLDADIEPLDAKRWRRSGFSADGAMPWMTAEISPTAARSWRTTGVPSPASAGRWVAAGFRTAASAAPWLEAGFVDPWKAGAFDRAGLTPTAAAGWARAGVDDVADIVACKQAGVSLAAARRWSDRCGGDIEDLLVWRRNGYTVDSALKYSLVGFRRYDELHDLLAHVELPVVDALIERGFDARQMASLLSARTGAEFVKEALRRRNMPGWIGLGVGAHELPQWWHLCGQPKVAAIWLDDGWSVRDLSRASQRTGLDPSRAMEWRKQGLGTAEMVEAASQGFGSPQEWLDAFDGDSLREYELWCEQSLRWLGPLGVATDRSDRLLEIVWGEGLPWATTRQRVFGIRGEEDWLDEIMNRAVFSDRIAFEPLWPATYESDDLIIVLDLIGEENVLAWVGTREGGVALGFDLEYFEPVIDTRFPEWRYAAGLAISWYLDCAVRIREKRPQRLFKDVAPGSSGLGFDRASVRYVPQKSFVEHVEHVRIGTRSAPRPHWVRGHRRMLPAGWVPRPETRERAPVQIRRTLKRNETWVSAYRTNRWEEVVLLNAHLSKYSALGQALGEAER